MKNNLVDGIIFRGMVLNALNNIYKNEKRINSMNVFPVADGDTGTNMRLTLENGYKNSNETKHLGNYLKELSNGMLLGARGNSGVILSQLFSGLYVSLRNCGVANPRELKNAFTKAYQTAYAAVVNPVEGTILTVAREGIDNIANQIKGGITIAAVFALYLKEMKKSQLTTPDLLPVLKEAGVLDSGAEGYIVIIEGMYKYLIGEEIESDYVEVEPENKQETAYFDENSVFEKGYCMEFLLQLLNAKNYKKGFILDFYIETLKQYGNSLVVLQNGTIVKVHIHTFVPNEVIVLSRQYGEFISFKLENMQVQHNEFVSKHPEKKLQEHKDFGIIAVVDGEGVENVLKDMNCHYIIQGGKTMNTSSEEFINAIETVNADHVVIFPNNSNIFEAANQAVKVMGANNVTIIPSNNILECYYALAMDVPDADYKTRINALNQGCRDIVALAISTAIKDYSSESFTCLTGDKVGFINNKMAVKSSNTLDVIKELFKLVENIEDKSGIIVFKGSEFDESLEDEIREYIEDEYSLDIEFVDGGQQSFELLIGVI